MIRAVVIPAAGLGSRLGERTRSCPKELLPVGGCPLLWGAVLELRAAGVTDVAVVTRPGKAGIAEFVAEHLPDAALVEQPAPTGVFDAVERGRAALGTDRPVVLFPDFVCLPDQDGLARLLAADVPREATVFGLVRRGERPMGPSASVQVTGHGVLRIDAVGPAADRGLHTALAELRGSEHTRRLGVDDRGLLPLLQGLAADGLLFGVELGDVLDLGVPDGHDDAQARFADGRARWRARPG